jgi:hypothetical protein
MFGQLDLEGIFKRYKPPERSFNFHEFWSEELHHEKFYVDGGNS